MKLRSLKVREDNKPRAKYGTLYARSDWQHCTLTTLCQERKKWIRKFSTRCFWSIAPAIVRTPGLVDSHIEIAVSVFIPERFPRDLSRRCRLAAVLPRAEAHEASQNDVAPLTSHETAASAVSDLDVTSLTPWWAVPPESSHVDVDSQRWILSRSSRVFPLIFYFFTCATGCFCSCQ